MYDRLRLQPGLGHDRSLHEICKGRALRDCLSRRGERSSNQHVKSEAWMSFDVSIGQRNSFCRRSYERAHETFSSCSGSFDDDISTPAEWPGGEAKSDAGSMLTVYCFGYMTDWDRYIPQRMGAYNSTQHPTTPDFDRTRKVFDFLLPRV